MNSNLRKLAIEIEMDADAGYHAVVIDAEDDSVIHVTNSFPRGWYAERAALDWIDFARQHKPAPTERTVGAGSNRKEE